VTWNERKPGWVGREPQRAHPLPPATAPDPAVVPAVVIVPVLPMFSPAAVAALLKVYRSTVQYWLENGKLESLEDNIGARYVLRDELVRFVRDYLKRGVQ